MGKALPERAAELANVVVFVDWDGCPGVVALGSVDDVVDTAVVVVASGGNGRDWDSALNEGWVVVDCLGRVDLVRSIGCLGRANNLDGTDEVDHGYGVDGHDRTEKAGKELESHGWLSRKSKNG